MNLLELIAGGGIALLLAAAGCLALCLSRFDRARLRFQLSLFLAAFAVRFALALVLYQTSLLTVLGDEDMCGWSIGADFYATWCEQGVGLLDLPALSSGAFQGLNKGYAIWIGVFFYLTGSPYRLTAAALSCFSGALTVVLTYRMARVFCATPRAATRVGWWACLFPSLLIWSAQTVKEPIVILLEVVVLYGCVRMRLERLSVRHFFLCALAIFLLTTLRFYAAYIIGGVMLASLALPRFGNPRFAIFSIITAVLVLIVFTQVGLLSQHEEIIEGFSLEHAQNFREGMARSARTGFGLEYSTKTSGGLSMILLVGWIYLLLAPFPWQLGGGSLRLMLTLPEQLIWWTLFFSGVLPGFLMIVRRRLGDFLPVVLFLLMLGLLYSLTTANVGTMYRQRAQFLPYLLIFGSLFFERRSKPPGVARAERGARSPALVWNPSVG